MNQVIEAVNRIRSFPHVYIDRNFLQGRDAVHTQLNLRMGEEVSDLYVDGTIGDIQEDMAEIRSWVEPYQLPDDYLFFLEFYGGLLIEKTEYNLIIDGAGPMCEKWYGFLIGDSAYTEPQRDGLLKIGELVFNRVREGRFPRIVVCMDLAGIVQQYSILGIGPRNEADPDLFQIIKDFDANRHVWNSIANSFTEWLDLIAATQGRLDYQL